MTWWRSSWRWKPLKPAAGYCAPVLAAVAAAQVTSLAGTGDTLRNYFSSQMAKLIRMETGYTMHHFINKYDGEPYTLEGLLKQVEDTMNGKVTKKVPELAGAR